MKATVARVIFLLIIFSASIGKSQVYDWAAPLAPTISNSFSIGYDVAVDGVGNVYMAGSMVGDFDADPKAGVSMLYRHGTMDGYICKYTSLGSLTWAFSIGRTNNAPGEVRIHAITCDNVGDVIVCGELYSGGIADFDPGPGTYNLSANIFIAKYNPSGNLIWAMSPDTNNIFTNGGVLQAAIKTDKANNIYITGYFSGTNDFDPGTDTCIFTTPHPNASDIFLAKYTSTGAFCWAKRFGNTTSDYGMALDLDDSANIYFAGTFQLSVDFDAGPGTNILYSPHPYNPFIAKYDSSGNHIWAFAIGPSWTHLYDLKLDHNGDIYVTGILQGTSDFDPGPGTAYLSSSGSGQNYKFNSYIAKYSSSGNYLWAFVLQSNQGTIAEGYSIGIDANNDVIAGGTFHGTIDFDPGVGVSSLTSTVAYDMYVAKYSPQGNYQWAFSLAGSFNGWDNLWGIATDNAGAFYVSGQFCGLLDFDPGPAVKTYYSPAASGATLAQAFVAKYLPIVPLPVELLSFTGKNKGEKNILEWVTASEINNSGFEIERSENASEFSKIGFVSGNGNTTTQSEYKFDDDNVKKDYYYRLKQVDYDGRFEYSDIIFLKKKSSRTFDVYPNLVVDKFFINGIDERSVIEVVDVLGKIVLTFNGLNEIDFAFPAGIYFVRVKDEEGVKRIVKL